MAEVFGCRALREGAQRTEKGNTERLFKRQTGGHDLAEKPGNALVRQGPRIDFLNATQHLRLALGAINVARIPVTCLDFPNLLRTLGATIEKLDQLCIDGVDLGPYYREFLLKLIAHGLYPAWCRHLRLI